MDINLNMSLIHLLSRVFTLKKTAVGNEHGPQGFGTNKKPFPPKTITQSLKSPQPENNNQ